METDGTEEVILYDLEGNQILDGYLPNGNAQDLYFDLGGECEMKAVQILKQ